MAIGFGQNIRVSIYGASHAPQIGVTVEGLPKGAPVDVEKLQAFLTRRAPGRNEWSTPRKEADAPEFISGLEDGIITGEKLEAIIRNTNTRPQDYGNVITVPRPAHADYPSWVKQGKIETGGGRWSARMTAPLCIAGGIVLQLLEEMGITIKAHIKSIGGIEDVAFSGGEVSEEVDTEFPVIDKEQGEKMKALIRETKKAGDSVGGIIECEIRGMKPGIGDALFGGLESSISQSIFAIPAVKGIEFGCGFKVAEMKGSQNNDPFIIKDGRVETVTNNHGGILGGMSSGMPIIFRAALKPTPSIGMEQQSVNLATMEPATLAVKGRHDPCIVPRAVPVVEAAAAIAIYDVILGEING